MTVIRRRRGSMGVKAGGGGGLPSTTSGYLLFTTGTSSFATANATTRVYYLAVGGGGAGSDGVGALARGGGGGAGQVLISSVVLATGSSYTVTVGAGGTGGGNPVGTSGTNTIFATLTAKGGCGGGPGGGANSYKGGNSGSGKSGGTAGGGSVGDGGGGDFAVGANTDGTTGGDGGFGTSSYFTGAQAVYGDGGGGCGCEAGGCPPGYLGGVGGSGGGGHGGYGGADATPGAGIGAGGGGTYARAGVSQAGTDGCVALRWGYNPYYVAKTAENYVAIANAIRVRGGGKVTLLNEAVAKATFWMTKTGSPTTGTISCKIYKVSDGTLVDTATETVAVSAVNGAAYQEYTFNFPSPVTLSQAVYIVADTGGATNDGSNYIRVACRNAIIYSQAVDWDGGTGWTAYANTGLEGTIGVNSV
jgi:hypothetical protein